mmetsp:Transcript_100008/g.158294  ORF Transcript_100008/g.158294 Transcript_100008/m.158294 type:complete len:241 (-) Transcript_100008:89-811(-)
MRTLPATDDEREKLGEALYLKVSKLQSEEIAGKITGMVLSSLEINEIQSVMDDESSLREKVDEALQLLRKGAEEEKTRLLEEELRQAEQWANGMQREWDEKERRRDQEKEELIERLATLEGRATTRLSVINDQSTKLESGLRKMQQRAAKVETALAGLEDLGCNLRDMEGTAEKCKPQEDLANLRLDLEKERSKLEGEKSFVSEKISEAEREAQRAKEERLRVEDLIAKAKREIDAIRNS